MASRSMGAKVMDRNSRYLEPGSASTHSVRFSWRTPYLPSIYMPGSSEVIMPGTNSASSDFTRRCPRMPLGPSCTESI